jgi:poly(A) polymerase
LPDSVVIQRKHHTISKNNISANALKVLNRLHQHEFEAHLVGGSVRDLLLGVQPKDFDVVTNAHPNEIKKLFRNARLIGRRFRLAHILFYRDIIEVATFRKSAPQGDDHKVNTEGMLVRDNEYGTITDDVWRRDFTINALYYNIADFSIVDFTGGFQDLKDKIVRMIGDPDTRYHEDPVRMLRAIRFCAKLDFQLEEKTKASLHQLTGLIKNVSSSRLFEEIVKMYHHGHGLRSQALLEQHHLFEHLFPFTHEEMQTDTSVSELIEHTLKSTDSRIKKNRPVTPAFLLAVFLWRPLLKEIEHYQEKGLPPLPALEKAMNVILSKQSQFISIPKRFTQSMREMWVLQFRLNRRHGNRAFRTLEHPRFRAAYDFLLLRTLVGEEDVALSDWWTTFQEVDEEEQSKMVQSLRKNNTSS